MFKDVKLDRRVSLGRDDASGGTGEEPTTSRRSNPGVKGEEPTTSRRSNPGGTGEEPTTSRRSNPGGTGEEPTTSRRSRRSRRFYSRGYLPHFDVPGLLQHITFHLADSLPRNAIDRMQNDIALLPKDAQTAERSKRIQDLLDSGLGSCVLRDAGCARIVEDSLLFGDRNRYHLLAWCIMPNHVHVLIEQQPDWPLAKIVQSWKRHTSRQIHLLESPSCTRTIPNPLWQREYRDRFIRDENHLMTVVQYIDQNPVTAGLSEDAAQWPFGSARFSGCADCKSAIPMIPIKEPNV